MKARGLFLLSLGLSLSACGSGVSTLPIVSLGSNEVVSTPISSQPPGPVNQESVGDTLSLAIKVDQVEEDTFEANQPLAARVNHQAIFLESYQKQVSRFEQSLIAQGLDPDSESGQLTLAQTKHQVLETLIDQLLIEQEATRLNIVLTEQVVEAEALTNIAQAQSQAQFEGWLVSNQLSYEEFKAMLRAQLITNQVFEIITHTASDSTAKEAAFSNWLTQQRAGALIERYVAANGD